MRRATGSTAALHPVTGAKLGMYIRLECGHEKFRGGQNATHRIMEECLTFPCYRPPQARW